MPLLGTQQTSRDLSQTLNTSSTCELLVLHADHPLLGGSPTSKLPSPQPLSALVLPGRCSLRRDYFLLLLLLRKLTSSRRRGALNALSVVREACANSLSPGSTGDYLQEHGSPVHASRPETCHVAGTAFLPSNSCPALLMSPLQRQNAGVSQADTSPLPGTWWPCTELWLTLMPRHASPPTHP